MAQTGKRRSKAAPRRGPDPGARSRGVFARHAPARLVDRPPRRDPRRRRARARHRLVRQPAPRPRRAARPARRRLGDAARRLRPDLRLARPAARPDPRRATSRRTSSTPSSPPRTAASTGTSASTCRAPPARSSSTCAPAQTVQGGSSITQQVAKLVWFDNTRTLERKIKEIPAALALEWKFSKNEILSIYLNRAYLGAGATGFEAASERYFGKSAADVTPAEAAMLAGLLRAPSRFAPTNDLARAQEPRPHHRRADAGAGLPDRRRRPSEARAHPAQLSAAAAARAGGAFADWVMSSGPEFLTRKTTEDVEVVTTFDPRVQRAAEAGAGRGLRHQAQGRLQRPGRGGGDVAGRRGAGDDRRPRLRRRRGPVQPRHHGPAPDRLAVQALRLRRRAAGRRQPLRPGARRAADPLHPRLRRMVAAELLARPTSGRST